ncbi:MAG TPA: MC/SLC25 family protein [Gammaproteobacteria bacterium]|nr:MC/SLC25 family protein [Gammaproteobacteria bacterium]
MQNRDKNSSNTHTVLTWLISNFNPELGIKKSIAVPLTQPLHVMQKMQQTRILTISQAYNEIHKTGKISSFFKGVIPGAGKEFFKNAFYKGAVIKYAPDMADWILPISISKNQYPLTHAVIEGTLSATLDTLIAGPIDNYGTYLATSHGANSKASFARELREEKNYINKLKIFYRGGIPATLKGTVAFTTFYATSQPVKNSVKQIFQLENQKEMPLYATFLISTMAGASVALTSSVFDIAKTQAQMPKAPNQSLFQKISLNWQKHGIRGVTAGVTLKFVMATLGWGITHAVTQRDKPNEQVKNEERHLKR